MALISSIANDTGTGGVKTTNVGTTTTAPTTYSLLKIGSRGSDVKQLQSTLNSLGYNAGTADGIYGSRTAAAVKAYQQAMGLTADGLAGQQTLSTIYSKNAATPPTVVKGTGTGSSAGTTGGSVAITDTGTNKTPAPTTPTPAPQTPNVAWNQPATTPTPAPVQQPAPQPKPTAQPTPAPVQQPAPTPAPVKVEMPAQTGGGSTQTGGTGGQTGGSSSGIQPPAQWTPEPYVPTPNPYIEELLNTKFEYDPFSDPEYLQRAAGYENQIAQMMVGRGGLWSSVKDSAVQSSLLTLQMDMTEQKYSQFLEDRNFKFQIAQFASDEENKNFNRWLQTQELSFNINKEEWDRYIQETELAFNIDKENWNRFAWEQEMAFNKEKEAFDQALAIAKHNADMAAQAHRQSMDRIAAEQAAQELQMKQYAAQVQSNIGASTEQLYLAAKDYDRDKRVFDTFYSDIKKTGELTTGQAKYFGISTGARIEDQATQKAILRKAAELDAYSQAIYSRAEMVGEEDTVFKAVSDWYDTIKGSNYIAPNVVTSSTR